MLTTGAIVLGVLWLFVTGQVVLLVLVEGPRPSGWGEWVGLVGASLLFPLALGWFAVSSAWRVVRRWGR